MIVVDQIPKLFGFHIEKAGYFFSGISWQVVQHLPQTSVATLALAVVTLLLIFGLERFAPRSPAPCLPSLWVLPHRLSCPAEHGRGNRWEHPRGLPSLVFPRFDLLAQLWPAAAGIALMSFTESIAAARAFTRSSAPVCAEPGIACARRRQRHGPAVRRHAGGRRYHPDSVNRRAGAHSQMAKSHRSGGRGDGAASTPHRMDAARRIGAAWGHSVDSAARRVR